MRGILSFSVPFEWEIEVRPGNAEISLLPFRYLGWVGSGEEDAGKPLRTGYRKALATLVRSLGGTEATYLADNTHLLEGFAEIENYAEMRQELEQQLGPPLRSFAQMEDWQLQRKDWVTGRYLEDRAYLVDDFSDLDWARPIGLPPYLRELRDKSGLPLPNPVLPGR